MMKFVVVTLLLAFSGTCYGYLFTLESLSLGKDCKETKFDFYTQTACYVERGTQADFTGTFSVPTGADIEFVLITLTWMSPTQHWTRYALVDGEVCYHNNKLDLNSTACSDRSIPSGTYKSYDLTLTVPKFEEEIMWLLVSCYYETKSGDVFQDIFLGEMQAKFSNL